MELLLTVLDDHPLPETGQLVEFFRHRLLFHDVDEANRAFDVGDDRIGVRVPAEDYLIALNLLAVLHHHDGA